MNQITDPDKITYKEARCKFAKAAPIMLIINLILALIMFLLSDMLFKQEEGFLGAILAGGFIFCGLLTYGILMAMSKRITRSEKMNKQKK